MGPVASLPYKIGTLLYAFNQADEVLLMRRTQSPNLGLWSPPGGKLDQSGGESPHACARREAEEELGLQLLLDDLRLTGIVSERGYEGQSHWLMFLFEIQPRLSRIPPPHREGSFCFFAREALTGIPLPQTDREQIWPLFWRHRHGFFVAHCDVKEKEEYKWTILQSHPSGAISGETPLPPSKWRDAASAF